MDDDSTSFGEPIPDGILSSSLDSGLKNLYNEYYEKALINACKCDKKQKFDNLKR